VEGRVQGPGGLQGACMCDNAEAEEEEKAAAS